MDGAADCCLGVNEGNKECDSRQKAAGQSVSTFKESMGLEEKRPGKANGTEEREKHTSSPILLATWMARLGDT